MSNIILGGVPRAGKSSLAQRLCRQAVYSHIPFDSLISAFGAIFPEHGISHYRPYQDVCETVKPFFFEWLRHLEYERIPVILDAYHLRPHDLSKEPLCSRYTILFVGYPSALCEQKCASIRHYARAGDWTESLSDSELRHLVTRYIAESRAIQQACGQTGYSFIDTSHHFNSVLEHAVQAFLPTTASL
jgi:hypothetical protein